MGFGLLALGTLGAFLLRVTLQNFSLGFVATLLGAVAIFFSTKKISLYEKTFRYSMFLSPALFLWGVADAVMTVLGNVRGEEAPTAAMNVTATVLSWSYVVLAVLLFTLLFFSASRLAAKVDLPALSKSFYIGDLLLFAWLFLYLFDIGATVTLVLWFLLSLFAFVQFIRCAKNIAPADEDTKPLPQKGLFAKMDRKLDEEEQKAVLKTIREKREWQEKKNTKNRKR